MMSIETKRSETLIKHEEAYPTGNASIERPSISEETRVASTKCQSFPSNTRHQPTVTVSLNDEDEDYIDRSNFYYRSTRNRAWDTSSRSFIPHFTGDQINESENEPLLKESIREDTLDGSSITRRSMYIVQNGCKRFFSTVMILCAFSAFVVAILACKRISELRFESFKDEELKTSHYILYSLGVIVMLATGIALSYTPVKSIVRSIRDYVHREPGYEEI